MWVRTATDVESHLHARPFMQGKRESTVEKATACALYRYIHDVIELANAVIARGNGLLQVPG
jgi:hypothetical protein